MQESRTGGIVGQRCEAKNLIIENCVNAGNISAACNVADDQPGGIMGFVVAGTGREITIKNCLNVGNIANSDTSMGAAGIIGNINNQSITNEKCLNLGNAESGDITVSTIDTEKVTITDYAFVVGYSENMLDSTNAKTTVDDTWDIITLDKAALSNAATFAAGGALKGWTAGTATNVPTPIAVPTAIAWANITANA